MTLFYNDSAHCLGIYIVEAAVDESASASAQAISGCIHKQSLEPIRVPVTQGSDICLDPSNAPIIFDTNQKRATFMIEKTGNSLYADVLKIPVHALLSSVPSQ